MLYTNFSRRIFNEMIKRTYLKSRSQLLSMTTRNRNRPYFGQVSELRIMCRNLPHGTKSKFDGVSCHGAAAARKSRGCSTRCCDGHTRWARRSPSPVVGTETSPRLFKPSTRPCNKISSKIFRSDSNFVLLSTRNINHTSRR